MTHKQLIVGAGVLLAAVAVALGATAGRRAISGDDTPSPTRRATSSTAPPVAQCYPSGSGGLTEFRDADAGFAVSHPAGWQRLEPSEQQVRLVVSPNRKDSILVRVITLDQPVAREDIPKLRTVTDEIVKAGKGVEVLEGPREIEVGGLPGHFYFYRFMDADSGQRGVHSHYFLFRDTKMFVLVFQALPEECFPPLAPLFDRVVATFQPL